ncbi:hypothetical protein KUV85_08535 [Nocardioides panacisoli]|uniref:hypothetical protein n=1 Tax=Nocardioides panacisoli TaxID=627624 RepID=UPI001C62CBA9|nr:hypothetical protein [Nocardioides panacisoli]QYJ05711.1 hypothetical protein KUV85_08535 [Nocardioides panacisoli]
MSAAATTGTPFAWADFPHALERARVVQCALSRVCGACSRPLGRPIAFLADRGEQDRNELHVPPLHRDCAEELLARGDADAQWEVVLTAGFEFIRPAKHDEDRRPRFAPNSLL